MANFYTFARSVSKLVLFFYPLGGRRTEVNWCDIRESNSFLMVGSHECRHKHLYRIEIKLTFKSLHPFGICSQLQDPITFRLDFKLERMMGIEPTSQAWEVHILPLNHTRINKEHLDGIFGGTTLQTFRKNKPQLPNK